MTEGVESAEGFFSFVYMDGRRNRPLVNAGDGMWLGSGV